MSRWLLLALTLLGLTLVAHRGAGLPLSATAPLLLAGVAAQGFAGYRRPQPAFAEPRRGLGLGRLMAWLLRALLGTAALSLALLGALWALR